jgi:hypothetical protein
LNSAEGARSRVRYVSMKGSFGPGREPGRHTGYGQTPRESPRGVPRFWAFSAGAFRNPGRWRALSVSRKLIRGPIRTLKVWLGPRDCRPELSDSRPPVSQQLTGPVRLGVCFVDIWQPSGEQSRFGTPLRFQSEVANGDALPVVGARNRRVIAGSPDHMPA